MSTEKKTTETKTEEMVKIRLPRVRGESDTQYWCINERDWLIRRGEEVEVPKFLADKIYEQEEAKEEAYKRREAIKNRSANNA